MNNASKKKKKLVGCGKASHVKVPENMWFHDA